jgi:hypothetical protein
MFAEAIPDANRQPLRACRDRNRDRQGASYAFGLRSGE